MRDQSIQRALEQRAASHGNQRLGHGVGQRPHALAAAGRQDHGGVDLHAAPIRRRAGGSRRSTQARKRRQRVVLQRTLEHPPDTRQVRQIVGLAVALQQPDEQSDDAGMALGRHQGEAGAEVFFVEPRFVEVMGQAGGVHGGRNVTAGILDQRDEIVGGVALLRILEIEQAAGHDARSSRQPHEIVLVVVAQQQRVGRRRQVGEAGAPGGAIGRRLLVRRRPAAGGGQIPVGQQHRRIDQRLAGIGAEAGQQRALAGMMQDDQHVGGARIELAFVAARVEHAGEGVVAEILQQQEAVGLVLGMDRRRAEAEPDQVTADAHERPHVFLRRRCIHDDGRAARPAQPEILAERGVARQQPLVGIAPAGAADEIGAQPVAFRGRQSGLLPADRRACRRLPWPASP